MVDLFIRNREETAPRRPIAAPTGSGTDAVLAAAGNWLLHHQRSIRAAQWIVVGVYALLVIVPAFLPLPQRGAHIWNNLTLFAQFVFWGIWWPFVLLSMVFVGRLWCGLLCPEGALSEAMSRHGRARHTPHWISWKGWPFAAFACTTAYGQFVSVYQYPKPALLILGGSTLAAMAVGYLFGRGKRVWCRYMCPVTGVFGLLAKLAPIHYRVDRTAWDLAPKPTVAEARLVNCAPLVPIRTMQGAGQCHMCGRCSGFRGAVTLARRSPSHEIVHVAGLKPSPWETWLIVFGLMGLAAGAFHWASSPWFVAAKQAIAAWLIDRGMLWPLTAHAPWWVLTSYPGQNDVMTPLDGVVLLGYLLSATLAIGGAVSLCLAASCRMLDRSGSPAGWRARFHHLAQSLIPVAGCGVFLGLFGLTAFMLHADGVALPFVAAARALLMAASGVWSAVLAWRICGLYAKSPGARWAATVPMVTAACLGIASWAAPF
jgi:polyferredoxin